MIEYKTKEVRVKQVVTYGGHSITANGLVNLTFKAAYSELTGSVELLQMLNNDIAVMAKINGKPLNLGLFRLKSIDIDSDGESKVKFSGNKDFVETDAVNEIPLNTDDVKEFKVQYKATVEYEEEVELENQDGVPWDD